MLEAPATEVRQDLKRLAQEGQWQQVLNTAEEAMASPCGRGWLELAALRRPGVRGIWAAITTRSPWQSEPN